MDFKRLRSNRGITILYVIAAMLLAVAVGAALMKMTNMEMGSSGDFAGIASAGSAARSGLLAAEGLIVDDTTTSIAAFKKFYDDNKGSATKTPVYLVGTSTTFESMQTNSEQKYRVSIIAMDTTDMTVTLFSEGQGKNGSRKDIKGYYKIGNLGFVSDTTNGVGSEDALFIANGSMKFGAHLNITGGARCLGDIDLSNGWCSGASFNGPFICGGNAKIPGNWTFNGVAYCKGNFSVIPVSVSPVGGIVFKEKCGFEAGFDEPGSAAVNPTVKMEKDCWSNGSLSTHIDDMNGKTYHHDGGVTNAATYVHHGTIDNMGTQIDIPDKLGIQATVASPQFNAGAIDPSYYLEWSAVKASYNHGTGKFESVTGYNKPFDANYDATGNTIDAAQANKIWDYANSLSPSKLWNDFAVVHIASGQAMTSITGNGVFNRKIIFINEGLMDQGSAAGRGWYDCAPGSITMVYNMGSYQLGQNYNNPGTFRGYIYNAEGSTSFNVSPASITFQNIYGAVHNMRTSSSPVDVLYVDDSQNTVGITYDGSIMDVIAGTGLVSNIGSAVGGVIITSIMQRLDRDFGLAPILRGLDD